MDIKTTTYKSLEWYIINEPNKEKLLFLKDSFTNEMIRQVFDKYDNWFDVQFNHNKTKIWWEESYIRKVLNDVFLKRFLDVKDLNIMKTTLELNGESKTTEDYVRLITKEEVKNLPLEVLKTKRTYGYWTMSPYSFGGTSAYVFRVSGSDYPGQLSVNWVEFSSAVRPVISLKSDNLISHQNSGLIIDSIEEDRKKIIRKKLERLRNL